MRVTLDADPKPTPRPRARVIAVKGRRPLASFYSPKEYKTWQTHVGKLLAGCEAPPAPLEGPLRVELVFTAERPKTTKLPHPRPDLDNLVKAVLDVVTSDGRFWIDDAQVSELCARKQWGEAGKIELLIGEA
ncbi:RusA family crossover junction endodeoxyribonuclease [Alteriqipengyuania flavescens]|uniref:RusA family crossover junction endodeoxyribonuclease n=1 Tax=Alteriqipengyuania flavescens TaxID=3053610 RepID=UPI0025B34D49|nr:RusA family crossover junction endodeoxyribonuclease [Alteriqipengyuania flavescens]WJY20051.1 RusA family crossover junction endodeoxyribonuclease [Alteriqipengyuania flavescens]WJY25992.1 RusA family crossover junction endodeoxyribonuclease [Alteriqipengyuania flavescens]